MKKALSLVLTVGILGAFNSFATDAGTSSMKQILSRVPAAELPARAAELVKEAKARDRGEVTLEVVAAGLGINPMAAPAIVGAIAKAVPDMAAIAAGTAAEAQPAQAAEIAKAAAGAAPGKTGRIVTAVCRAAPGEYKLVALAVGQVAPASAKEILRGVGSAIPELKPRIDAQLAGYGYNPPSVASVLESPGALAANSASVPGTSAGGNAPGPVSAANAVETGGQTVQGASIAPPTVPGSGTGQNGRPNGSGPVPRGHRDYSAP